MEIQQMKLPLSRHIPWNKGKLIGQKPSLHPKHIWPIRTQLQLENKVRDLALFNFATGISLLLFYAFAMQCMSTLAIVKRETNSWKWPILQLFIMSGIAYIVALIAFQLLK